MMTFLKTILIMLLVYYALKFLFRLLAPYAMRYLAKKVDRRFESSFGYAPGSNNQPREKEGSVSIDSMPPPKTKGNSGAGEYVDYEEID